MTMSAAFTDVLAERGRQMTAEGWTPEHDDQHMHGEMARAAACYADHAGSAEAGQVAPGYAPQGWPWAARWWKPKDRRRDLVRAAALIVAEIERLDRADAAERDYRLREMEQLANDGQM